MTAFSSFTLALAAAFGWAFFDLARRALAGRLAAWTLVVVLTTGAVPLLVAWAVIAGDWRLEPAYWPPALASVALNVAANFCYFRSFQLAPLSVTLPMLAFTPLFASLLGAALLGETLGTRGAVGALLVVSGGLALGLRSDGSRFEAGTGLMLVVAFLWSATLLLDKRALAFSSAHVHAITLNAGVALGGLGALAASRRLGDLRAAAASTRLVLVAIAIGAVALTVQLAALRDLPLGVIETLKRGVGGLSAVVCGRWLYAEPLTARKVAAVVLMTLGVALLLL